MNFPLPPDKDWKYITKLTGDGSWEPEQMRHRYVDLERAEYLPPGISGRGFDGYVSVRFPDIVSPLNRCSG